MRLRVVCNLVAHSGSQPKRPAIRELGLEVTGHAEQDVSFAAPMVGAVSG